MNSSSARIDRGNGKLPPMHRRLSSADVELLFRAQTYLNRREQGLPPGPDLEADWLAFYQCYSSKIRKFALSCGAEDDDVADCIQEVWTELLMRLPNFRLDSRHGKFDSWLFHIVRGKIVNIQRTQNHHLPQDNSEALRTALDGRPSPDQGLEMTDLLAFAWDRLQKRLADRDLQILQMRLIDGLSVPEVAEKLHLSQAQVWYRYHRTRRDLQRLAPALGNGQCASRSAINGHYVKLKKIQNSAQEKAPISVARDVPLSTLLLPGGGCVDYVCQRVELGRRELAPEWKVEWNCDAVPRPILYIRKTANVAYAEICGSGDLIHADWPAIVNAAIAAGVAAGIATIIATPTAALPIFQAEFYKRFPGKGAETREEKIQVALSAMQEASGPWCVCKE